MPKGYREINLETYTLKEFTNSKLVEPTIEVIFPDENQKRDFKDGINGQLRCRDLTFPFIKEGFGPSPVSVPVKNATVLVHPIKELRVKKVFEITLDISAMETLEYLPGDTIAILPQNSVQEVTALLDLMKIGEKADQPCQIQPLASNQKKQPKFPYIPPSTTPRELLRDILNIRAVPKKQFLRALANLCSAPEQQNFLNSIASKEGSKFYNELFLEKGFTLLELLCSCNTCQPTLSLLIEHLPRLVPRPYSIANSPLMNENEIKIIFSVLNERPGVTTNMLASIANTIIQGNLKEPRTVPMYPRKTNEFRYTEDNFSNNQIFIAIGTGVSPFLGFLEYKAQLLRNGKSKPGLTWLFVGATVETAIPHRLEIFELLEKHDHRVLEKYFESFSRQPDSTYPYIQEQLVAYSSELVEFFLTRGTTMYVCADGAKISQAIEYGVSYCLQEELGLKEDEANEMLKQFRATGKYREDLWT